MRRLIRVTVLVLLSYLLQATILPSFKIGGVILDVMSITIYTIGYACGTYSGMMAGVFLAAIVEVVSGDPPGLSLIYVAIGYFGSWVVRKMRAFTRVGNRTLEHNVKRFAPMVLLGVAAMAKETLYMVYFYLTGMEVGFGHISRVMMSGLWAAIAGFLLLPLEYGILRRKKEDTLLGKWKKRRIEKSKAKPIEPKREKRKRGSAREEIDLLEPKDILLPVAGSGVPKKKERLIDLLNPKIVELEEPEKTPSDEGGMDE